MASVMYNSFKYDSAVGSIDLDGDTFHMILVTSAYTPDIDAHTKRSNITNEVVGTGYAAGGVALTSVVVSNDLANDRTKFASANVSWTTATITARGAVICKWRGGAATADELCCYLDFGADYTATAATFQVTCPANGWFYLA